MTPPPPAPPADAFATTRQEVTAWFFDDYLPRWAANGSGRAAEDAGFVLDYWSVPMHVSTAGGAMWLADEAAVRRFLALNMSTLKASGYDHTKVLDRRVRVYHAQGAAIDVVWSRCRADGAETQRTAMHYELARAASGTSAGGWRVVGMQVAETVTADLPW